MYPAGSGKPETPSDRFENWQLADEMASSAERAVCDAFTACANGVGLRPSDLQLEVSHALRIKAQRLLSAAARDIDRGK